MIMTHTDERLGFETCRVRCACHTSTHFIEFNYVPWESGPGSIDVYFCADRIGGFFRRLGRALKYVFWTQELVTADICLTVEDVEGLTSYLVKLSNLETQAALKNKEIDR